MTRYCLNTITLCRQLSQLTKTYFLDNRTNPRIWDQSQDHRQPPRGQTQEILIVQQILELIADDVESREAEEPNCNTANGDGSDTQLFHLLTTEKQRSESEKVGRMIAKREQSGPTLQYPDAPVPIQSFANLLDDRNVARTS